MGTTPPRGPAECHWSLCHLVLLEPLSVPPTLLVAAEPWGVGAAWRATWPESRLAVLPAAVGVGLLAAVESGSSSPKVEISLRQVPRGPGPGGSCSRHSWEGQSRARSFSPASDVVSPPHSRGPPSEVDPTGQVGFGQKVFFLSIWFYIRCLLAVRLIVAF